MELDHALEIADESLAGGYNSMHDQALHFLAAEVRRRASPASVPEGYAIVPVEPTPEMLDCFIGATEARGRFEDMLSAAPTPPVIEDRWQPIETAPRDSKTMFVVIGISVDVGNAFPYTTDPWCVWRTLEGRFERWPHKFQPTHWMPLPKAPAMQEDKP